VGISAYPPDLTRRAVQILASLGTRCLIHQPKYSMLVRDVEHGLLDALEETGIGCIAFSVLAQGLLSEKYLGGIPAEARINRPGGGSLKKDHLKPENLAHVKALNEIAKKRGQSLAQMALAWTLRDKRVTTALLGASSAEQIKENVGALKKLDFTAAELAAIDQHAVDLGINLWEKPSTDQRP
jgi:L-glyceraldehyde 3-phosphate reductase